MKTILLQVQNDASMDSRWKRSRAARSCSAHLDCLHVTPIEGYMAFDSFGGVFVMDDVIKSLNEEETTLRSRIEDDLRGEDVSWDYQQVTGNITSQIVSHAALADLVVTGRAPHRSDFGDASIDLLGDLLHRSRTPLFIAGDGNPCDPGGRALIAWDGSYEAANAVRSAIGLLRHASDVRVLQITEQKDELFPTRCWSSIFPVMAFTPSCKWKRQEGSPTETSLQACCWPRPNPSAPPTWSWAATTTAAWGSSCSAV